MTRKAAIIGGGVIGGGWAARFLLNGWNVSVFDPDPQAERKIGEVLANAFQGTRTRFCIASFTSDWLFPTSEARAIVHALNAGGVDPEAMARVDLEKMRLAGEHPVENWLPRVLGPMGLRPGMEHLHFIPGNRITRPLPFERDSTTTSLLLLLQHCRAEPQQSSSWGAPTASMSSVKACSPVLSSCRALEACTEPQVAEQVAGAA